MIENPKLMRFAEILFGADLDEYRAILDDFRAMPNREFAKKYPFCEYLCADRESFEEDDEEDLPDYDSELLFLLAEHKDLMGVVDWSGEEYNGQMAEKIDGILKKRGLSGFSWDTEAFDATVDFDKLRRGDYILLLFDALDKRLRDLGLRLTFFLIGSDGYPYTVLPEADFAKVDRLCWDVYGVFGTESFRDYDPTGGRGYDPPDDI